MKSSVNISHYYGLFSILLAAFLWGTTGTVASLAPTLSPLAVGAAAMGGGGILQAILARRQIAQQINDIQSNLSILLVGVIAVVLYPLAFYSSMHLAGITIGTVVSMGTAPLFTAILERVFDKKRLSLTWFISFILGVTGVALLSIGESSHVSELDQNRESQKFIGLILGLVAGFTYALYSWSAKKLIERKIHSKAAMGTMFGGAALFLLPVLLITGDHIFSSNINLYVVGYMIFIPMFLGYVLFGYGLKTIDASKAITLTLFEPVVAAIFAITVVGESLNVLGWFGMGLIMICLLLLSKKA